MKKSEIYLYAQKAVCESSLAKSIKLEILAELMDEAMVAKLMEDVIAKQPKEMEATDE